MTPYRTLWCDVCGDAGQGRKPLRAHVITGAAVEFVDHSPGELGGVSQGALPKIIGEHRST